MKSNPSSRSVCPTTFQISLRWAAALLLAATSSAVAQRQSTPGSPSVPLRAQAITNGVASRITYQYNTEFVTVGAVGNPVWTAPDDMQGFGRVDYEYRIGRTEITTSQWAAFLSAAMARPSSDRIPWLSTPSVWGGMGDPTYFGPGARYVPIPGRENFAVGDISWRAAAVYCNWLHNGQQTTRESFLSGAYDVSTFGVRGNIFTDQAAHSPDAKFWIPTMSEWMKAAYYDPNAGGLAENGYWRYENGTSTPLRYGAPQDGGQANAGFSRALNGTDATLIPLMSYTDTQSPWGLLDMAGATEEWTESIFEYTGGYKDRIILGSSWTSPTNIFSDRLGTVNGAFPAQEGYFQGFRIAASVPTPGGAILLSSILCSGMRLRIRSKN